MFSDERMMMYYCVNRIATARKEDPEIEPLMREVFMELLEQYKVSLRKELDKMVDQYYKRFILGKDTPFELPFPKRRTMIHDEQYALNICANYLVYVKLADYPEYENRELLVKMFLQGAWVQCRDMLDSVVKKWMNDPEIVEQVKRDIESDRKKK